MILRLHLQKRVVIHARRSADGPFAFTMQPTGTISLDPPGITIQAKAWLG